MEVKSFMKLFFIYTLLFFTLFTSLQAQEVQKIQFESCLNHRSFSLEKYQNKVIVLDFWATWCAPCIAQFPHVNQLIDTFADENVLFLSITKEEDLEKIKKVLNSRKLNAYNLVDK